jgi:uncharacterized protein YaiE (UPF0345 family)
MGTGYVRNDTANNIADGNVINASDLDGEFDAIQAAFNATTGHSHDGTTGEGPQIGTGGIADTAVTTAKIADLNVTTGKIANDAVTLGTKTSGNYVATAGVSGVGLSGSASAEGATFTVTSNATSANTASTIVARDASGNFSAGTITAALTGTASNAALLDSLDSTQFLRSDAADTKTAGDLSFSDNVKAVFGAGSDLQIYHDGSHSNIRDVGTGNLYLSGSTYTVIEDASGTDLARFDAAGAANLFYNGSIKLATTATGADITGTLTADGILYDAETNFSISSNGGTILDIDANNNGAENLWITHGGGNDIIAKFETTGDISFYDSTGTTQGFFWDASTQRLGLGLTNPARDLHINGTAANAKAFARFTHDGLASTGLDVGYSSAGYASVYNAENTAMVFSTNATERLRITSGGNVGIGTASPSTNLEINGGTNNNIVRIVSTDANANIEFADNTTTSGLQIGASGDNMKFGISGTEAMRIDSSGNLGVGTSSPSYLIHADAATSTDPSYITASSGSAFIVAMGSQNSPGVAQEAFIGTLSDHALKIKTNNTERLRIDTSGNLLVGTTDTALYNNSTTGTGFHVAPSGWIETAATGTNAIFNKLSSDGTIAEFRKDGTTVGVVGASSSDVYIGTGDTGFRFQDGSDAIVPFNTSTLAASDNVLSLGGGSSRFKNAYFSGTVYADQFLGQNDTNTGIAVGGNDVIQLSTGGSERARVDASGNLLVGKTTTTGAFNTVGIELRATGLVQSTVDSAKPLDLNRKTTTGEIIGFNYNGTAEGSVTITASGVTYNTTSDLRLKENIEPLVATDKLMAMNPVSYNWKADPDGPRSMGFIAQEMQEVMPEAVAVGDDEDAMMSMDYGRITPILVSALQDAHRKIEQLEQRIADMEAK